MGKDDKPNEEQTITKIKPVVLKVFEGKLKQEKKSSKEVEKFIGELVTSVIKHLYGKHKNSKIDLNDFGNFTPKLKSNILGSSITTLRQITIDSGLFQITNQKQFNNFANQVIDVFVKAVGNKSTNKDATKNNKGDGNNIARGIDDIRRLINNNIDKIGALQSPLEIYVCKSSENEVGQLVKNAITLIKDNANLTKFIPDSPVVPALSSPLKIGHIYHDTVSQKTISTLGFPEAPKVPVNNTPSKSQTKNIIKEKPAINLVICLDNDTKLDFIDALYLTTLSPPPILISKQNGVFEISSFEEFTPLQQLSSILSQLNDYVITNPDDVDVVQRDEHDTMIAQNIKNAIALVNENNLKVDVRSINSLVAYQYAETYTKQQKISIQQNKEIAEYVRKLENTVKDYTQIKNFQRLFDENSTLMNLWSDTSSLPNNISMVVFSEYVDYGLLYVFIKVLEKTNHNITSIYIPKEALDDNAMQGLKLNTNYREILKPVGEGGLYEILDKPTDINLIVDFHKGAPVKFSQVIAYTHILESRKVQPGYVELTDNQDFIFTRFFNIMSRIDDESHGTMVGYIGGSVPNANEAMLKSPQVKSILLEIKSFLKQIKAKLDKRKALLSAPVNSQIREFNDSIGNEDDDEDTEDNSKSMSLYKEVSNFVKRVQSIQNDFYRFIRAYRIKATFTKEQNQLLLSNLKQKVANKTDAEFQDVLEQLQSEYSSALLAPLGTLPTNINVLIMNYSGMKQNYVMLIKDILSVYNFDIKAIYADKKDASSDLISLLSPQRDIVYTNIYEVFDKMFVARSTDLNVNLIINGDTTQKTNLSVSQTFVAKHILQQPNTVYFGIVDQDGRKNLITDLPNKTPDDSDKQLANDIKKFVQLSSGKRLAEDNVELQEVTTVLQKRLETDNDLSYFLEKTVVKRPVQDVYTDQVKGLMTYLVDKDRKELSENIFRNLDTFKGVVSKLPVNNNLMVVDFLDVVSSFDIAILTTRMLLKSLERNVKQVIYTNSTFKDQLATLFPNVSDDNRIQTRTYTESKTYTPTVIVKGDTALDMSFLLFLKMLGSPSVVVIMFDFDKQSVLVRTVQDIIQTTKIDDAIVDKFYTSFNVVDAVRAKLSQLNKYGLEWFNTNTFQVSQFEKELSELEGLVTKLQYDDTSRRHLVQVVREYKDALVGIEAKEKIETISTWTNLLKVIDDTPDKSGIKGDEMVHLKDVSRLINDAFVDDVFSKPELLKYKVLVSTIQHLHNTHGNVYPESLHEYFDFKLLSRAKTNYDNQLNNILGNSNASKKFEVLGQLFDNIYKFEFANQHLTKTLGVEPKGKDNFIRLLVGNQPSLTQDAKKQKDNYYSDFYLLNSIIKNTQKQEIGDRIMKALEEYVVNDDYNKVVSEIVAALFTSIEIKCTSFKRIQQVISHNVKLMVSLFNKWYEKVWDKKRKNKGWKSTEASQALRTAFSPFGMSLHIIPTLVNFEPAIVFVPHSQSTNPGEKQCSMVDYEADGGGKNDVEFVEWLDTINSEFVSLLYKGSTNTTVIVNRFISKGKEYLSRKLVEIKDEEGIVLIADVIDNIRSIVQEVQRVMPSANRQIAGILGTLNRLKSSLNNDEIAYEYFVNKAFQKEIIQKQMWLHLLLVMKRSKIQDKSVIDKINEGEKKAKALFAKELDMFETLSEQLKKIDEFKTHDKYVSALISKSNKEIPTSQGGPNNELNGQNTIAKSANKQPDANANKEKQPVAKANNEEQESVAKANKEKQPDANANKEEQPVAGQNRTEQEPDANKEEQPDANANKEEQPVAGQNRTEQEPDANKEEQPDANANKEEQPDANANKEEQPDANANKEEQPVANAKKEEQPVAGQNRTEQEPVAKANNEEQPVVEQNRTEQESVANEKEKQLEQDEKDNSNDSILNAQEHHLAKSNSMLSAIKDINEYVQTRNADNHPSANTMSVISSKEWGEYKNNDNVLSPLQTGNSAVPQELNTRQDSLMKTINSVKSNLSPLDTKDELSANFLISLDKLPIDTVVANNELYTPLYTALQTLTTIDTNDDKYQTALQSAVDIISTVPSELHEDEEKPKWPKLGGAPEQTFIDNKTTIFYKVLKFLLGEGDDTLKARLGELFNTDVDGDILVKTTNEEEDKSTLGFQFGGIKLPWSKEVAPSDSIPEFKKPVKEKYEPSPIIPTQKRSLTDSVSMIMQGQADITKYILYVAKKFMDKNGNLEQTQTINLDDVYKNILRNDENIQNFVSLDNEVTAKQMLSSLDQQQVRQNLNTLLKELKYDTNRITNIVKTNKLDKFDGFAETYKSDKASPNTQPQNTQSSPQVFASASQAPEQTVITKTMVQPQHEKATTVSVLANFKMPTFISTNNESKPKIPNLASINKEVLEIIQEIDAFAMRMKRKQLKWLDELNAMVSQGQISLKTQIQNKVNMLSSGNILELEKKKVSIQLLSLFKKFIDACENKANVSYAYFKDFFISDKRRQIRELLNYMETYAYINSSTFITTITDPQDKQNLTNLQSVYKNVIDSFNLLVNKMHTSNKEFYTSLSSIIEDTVKDNYMMYMRDKERGAIVTRLRGLIEAIETYPDKIKYFYTLSYPVTEMFDTQFIILYVVKILRIISFRFSMNMATNIFLQKYESIVYDKKQTPPSLISYMFMFLAFDLFFNVFLLVSLGLCGFLFKTDNNAFPIDKYLFTKFGFDYVISTTVILLIGMLVGKIVKDKKYFRYKTEGERGIRAFEEIMKSIASIITALPLFLVVS
jgi:hypothetical protein